MRKRRKVVNNVLDSYKIPSKEILRYRSEFFGLWRRSDDHTTTWMKRVQNCIHHCKFPTNTTEHLLVDRFICGLNAKELKSIQKAKKSWTAKQLLEHFSKESNAIAYIEATLTQVQSVHQIENISLNVVKSEPTEEECMQKDPLNEVKEDTNSVNDKKSIANLIKEELRKASEGTNSRQALGEEINHEILINSVEFERNKNDQRSDVTGATVSSNDFSSPAMDVCINDVDENVSNSSTEKQSNKTEYVCTAAQYTEVPSITNHSTAANVLAPCTSASTTTNKVYENFLDTFEMVKVETSEEECLQKDSLNESKEGKNTKPTVDEINDELMEAPEEIVSSEDEETNFQRALNEKIDHELLNNGMQFECEDYKFTVRDVISTVVTTAINSAPIADAPVATNDIIAINKSINDVTDENLSNRSIEEAPNRNDQQKHRSDSKKALIIIVTPVPSATVTNVTNVTTDNDDKNPANISIDKEPNQNDQPVKRTKPPKRHTCKKCRRSFNRPSKLELHIKSVHKGIRDHVCKECGKRYVRLHELKVHARTHTGERPHVCDECGVSYAYSSTLAKHKRSVHLGIRPHVCQICDKHFTMKDHLNEHSSTHSTEKPFMCDQCGKAFGRKSILRQHRNRVHQQQIRSHACVICDKRFLIAAELKKHSLTHTGERPHACDQCDKKFAQLSTLKLHKNSIHQGLRPHACPHCEKRFKTTNHLKQHLTIHTGVKAYTCDQCDKSFALGHHLSSHKKSVHQLKG